MTASIGSKSRKRSYPSDAPKKIFIHSVNISQFTSETHSLSQKQILPAVSNNDIFSTSLLKKVVLDQKVGLSKGLENSR